MTDLGALNVFHNYKSTGIKSWMTHRLTEVLADDQTLLSLRHFLVEGVTACPIYPN